MLMKVRYIVQPRKRYYVIMFYRAFYKAYPYAICWEFCSKNIVLTIPGGDFWVYYLVIGYFTPSSARTTITTRMAMKQPEPSPPPPPPLLLLGGLCPSPPPEPEPKQLLKVC